MATSKKRTQIAHRHFFGSYLNMARYNAYMILKHLTDEYKIKGGVDEESLSDVWILDQTKNGLSDPYILDRLLKDLRHFFPFLSYLYAPNSDLSDFNKITSALKAALKLINPLRNAHSHYIHLSNVAEYGDFPRELPTVYTSAIGRLLTRFNHEEKGFKETHIDLLKASNNVAYTAGVELTEKTLTFFICLFLERKYTFRFLSGLQCFDEPNTPQGRATLWSYALFCCRLPQPKLDSSDIMLDMINELGKCPDPLFHVLSDEDRQTFIVPKTKDSSIENSDNLDTEGDESENNESDTVKLKRHESNKKEEAFKDRFAYFALRYFDDKGVFPLLRFQVQLGKYTKERYRKTIFAKEQDRLLQKPIHVFGKLLPYRNLYDKVNQDDKSKRFIDTNYIGGFPVSWQQQIEIENEIGEKVTKTIIREEVDQFSPHYNIKEGTIGFRFISKPNADSSLPDLPQNDTESFRHNDIPEGIISVYELKNLFLYDYLCQQKKITVRTEKLIRDYLRNFKRFVKDVKENNPDILSLLITPPDFQKNKLLPYVKNDRKATKAARQKYNEQQTDMEDRRKRLSEGIESIYKIPYNAIPDDIREYLLGYQPPKYVQEVKKIFKAQTDFVDKQIEKINKFLPEIKETKERIFKVGEIATWLAEDIVSLMPAREHIVNGKSHKQKINNDQYRSLQACLAYFSTNKQAIIDYFEELHLVQPNPKTQHPFLAKINLNRCRGILEFYESYLIEKRMWLKKATRFVSNNTFKTELIEKEYGHVLPMERPKNTLEAINKMKNKDYDKIPVFLPRGFFNKAIVEAVGLPETSNAVFALKTILNEDTQPFYNLTHYKRLRDKEEGQEVIKDAIVYLKEMQREIEYIEELGKHKKLKDEDKYELKDLKKAERRFFEQERLIRYVQSTDRALWLMVKERVKTEHAQIQDELLTLSAIDNVLDIEVDTSITIHNRIINAKLPIRRYGDLRRIAKDIRLESLVKYYPANTIIDYLEVEKELTRYDERREAFFGTIYNFEENVKNKFSTEFDAEYLLATRYYSHNYYLDIATNHLPDATLKNHYETDVVMLRNKFSHNQIPDYTDSRFNSWLTPKLDFSRKDFVNQIFDIAEKYYNDLLAMI